MKNKKNTEESGGIFGSVLPIKEILLGFVASFFGNFIEQLQENITERIEEAQADLKVKAKAFARNATRIFIAFFLLTLGGIFLFFGLANALDHIFKIDGAGFLLVGGVMTFFGLIATAINLK